MSTGVVPVLMEHYDWTRKNFVDANRSSSLLQVCGVELFIFHYWPTSEMIRRNGCLSGRVTDNPKEVSILLSVTSLASHHSAVLDIGCYTGLSAIAWYEGTRETQAQVVLFLFGRRLSWKDDLTTNSDLYHWTRSKASSSCQEDFREIWLSWPHASDWRQSRECVRRSAFFQPEWVLIWSQVG